ncbi:MAG: flagellar biosynthesis protein FlhA [Candidatus Eremiobacteraeota bacterium]|nr:flagellar biosynthesis protein FlhA [Candidatus Eremiobacteraeota bacterium]
MEQKDKKTKYEKNKVKLNIFHLPEEKVEFIPWESGQKGNQSFLKLKKDDDFALFYAGEKNILEADIQKALFKLTNEGWETQGDVTIDFDGRQEKEIEELFDRDLIRLEIGLKLLPLVDPQQGSPLIEMVKQIRKDIAGETGFVTPGIRVRDNLNLQPDSYVIYLKETPVAVGEIFIDRFLAIGTMEKLTPLKGWSTREPAYNLPAKWIEHSQRDEAEVAEIQLMGPLNVIITHLKESVVKNLKDLMGMQEVKIMLDRLMETHPIVVEDFVKDKKKIRLIRKILQNLVSERVSIRDMVTIMETIGDHEDDLRKTDLVTEMVRIALARRICWSYLDEEGKIAALVLSRELEEKIQNSIIETRHGLRMVLPSEEADSIIRNIRKTLEDFKFPRVLFCDPPSRLYFRRLTESSFPQLGILSTAEIMRGMKIEILGEVKLPSDVPQAKIPGKEEGENQNEVVEEKEETRGFLGFLK